MEISKKLKINFKSAFFAQLTSLTVSLIMAFVVPKFITVIDYSYWQLFIFYNILIIFLNLGYNQGIYLKYGGISLEKLPGLHIGQHLVNVTILQLILALPIFFYADCINDPSKAVVFIFIAVASIVNNLSDFYCYLFQTINKINHYAVVIVTYNFLFICALFGLILCQVTGGLVLNFKILIFAYLLSRFVALVVGCKITRKLIGKHIFTGIKLFSWHDSVELIKIGLFLSASDLVGFLVLGLNRLTIEHYWGITTFGLVSFSLQLSNFLMTFIKQISLVLFPYLRTETYEYSKKFFLRFISLSNCYSPLLLLAYVPIYAFVVYWLPQYVKACEYLVMLLPICIYEMRMQILGVTFLKVFRHERALFGINIVALLISFICMLLFGVYMHNLDLIVLSMLGSIMIRSVLTDIVLYQKVFKEKLNYHVFSITLCSFAFVGLFYYLPIWQAGLCYVVLCICNSYWQTKNSF